MAELANYFDLHYFGHELVARYYEHQHWWLHMVLHVVLVLAPLGVVGLLGLGLWRWLNPKSTARMRSGAARAPIAHLPGSSLVPGLFRYIFQQTWQSQIVLVLASALAMPLLYASLELPKLIINGAINSKHFPHEFLGVTFEQLDFLFALCLLFLLTAVGSGVLKYSINVYKGRLGETVIRQLRISVFGEWQRRGGPGGTGQLIPLMVQEIEAVGGFCGEAVAVPVLQGGTALTILVFMIVQDPILGAAAIAGVPLQVGLNPALQRRLNKLGRERMREMRDLGRLLEGAGTGSRGGRQHDNRDLLASLKRIQQIRFEIYRTKFFMKGLNNFISQLTPFFFFTIGGYLVIEGKLSFGALVATLAAYKDLWAPLRELFDYYRTKEDVRVRYEETRRYLAAGIASPLPHAGDPFQIQVANAVE
jgi:ABC-type multidrug transport system fused ATPase/permease subunit